MGCQLRLLRKAKEQTVRRELTAWERSSSFREGRGQGCLDSVCLGLVMGTNTGVEFSVLSAQAGDNGSIRSPWI